MAVVALVAAPLQAQDVTLTALLTTSQEPPGVVLTTGLGGTGDPRPMPSGFATFVLNAARTQMTMTATIFNIDFGPVTGGAQQSPYTTDNLLNAHIHANGDPLAVTRPVVWGFIGAPFNDTAPTDVVITPFTGGLIGGTVTSKWDALEGNNTTLTAQVPNILAGLAYINFHTVQNPGGEIRGQLAVVPEPSTYVLMATGIGALGMIARRRRMA
jgi:hypothetical protein